MMSGDPKISLFGAQVIVSYRESDIERRQNLYAVLRHLDLTYTDYELWLTEADVRPRFDWGALSDPKIRHIFTHYEGPFPKALLYNTAVRLCRGDLLCFHDADSVAQPSVMTFCAEAVRDFGVSGALNPFRSVLNVAGELRETFLSEPRFEHFSDVSCPNVPDVDLLYGQAPGGIVFFRRAEYCRVGGYNMSFKGWGGEDDELYIRATKLGVAWHCIEAPLIHLHHGRAERHTLMAEVADGPNHQLAQEVMDMSIEDLSHLAQDMSSYFQ